MKVIQEIGSQFPSQSPMYGVSDKYLGPTKLPE